MSGHTFVTLKHCICLAMLFLPILLWGCGGGGGGGGTETAGSNTGGDPTFTLDEMFFGRPRFDAAGELIEVINPASLLQVDPITGLELEGYPQPLYADESLSKLYSLNLGESTSAPYKVKVIPRNAVLVLDFTKKVDPDSLKLDGLLPTDKTPISVVTSTGEPVNVEIYWGGWIGLGGDKVVVNPVFGSQIGFDPSPLLMDQNGNPKTVEGGYMRLSVISGGTGKYPLLSSDGRTLGARTDLFGTPLKPVGFNPGNGKLDFIDYGNVSFNGFLPDISAPRIIREVQAEGKITDVPSAASIQDDTKNFVTEANNNEGEWAGALFVLRPGKATEERARVLSNGSDTLYLDLQGEGSFTKPPAPGDSYQVKRAEFFEPIPGFDNGTTVDPVNHPKDPYDPQDAFNSDLMKFAIMEQVRRDASGKPVTDPDTGEWIWDPAETSPGVPYDPGPTGEEPIHPSWRISFRFSEPMSQDSFRPYETFFIVNASIDVNDPGFDYMLPGRAAASDSNRVISFEPVVASPYGEEPYRLIGFGGKPKTLRLVMRVVPPADQVHDFYQSLGPDKNKWPEGVVEDLTKEGVLGIYDLGGQPLGLPPAFLDQGNPHSVLLKTSPGRGAFVPAVDIKLEFNTMNVSEQEYPETGVLVHRFMGLPKTALDTFPEQVTGIIYRDHFDKDFLYGPNIADTSVGLNGFLSGRQVEHIQHVFDDYNHPPPSSPTYPDPIFKLPFGTGTPINCSRGCRFQHIYRRGDASPDVETFTGTVLDLKGLAWAPVGGSVDNTKIEEMSIGVGYSSVVPNTRQEAGIPENANSGILANFNNNFMNNPIPGELMRTMVVGTESVGVSYVVDWRNIFQPKNQGGGQNFNNYLPWPDFSQSFAYDSSASMLIEYRMDPNLSSGVALTNGFAFHAGIISSMMPRFRVYIRGGAYVNDSSGTPQYIQPDVWGASAPTSFPNAANHLAKPGLYGDNSRYLMVFEYVKRLSRVQSPFLGYKAPVGYDVYFLNPIIEPPVEDAPFGTKLTMRFRSTPNPDSVASYSPWVNPDEVESVLDEQPFNDQDYLRFEAVFEANVEQGIVPTIDTVSIPFLIELK